MEYLVIITILGFVFNSIILIYLLREVKKANAELDFIIKELLSVVYRCVYMM